MGPTSSFVETNVDDRFRPIFGTVSEFLENWHDNIFRPSEQEYDIPKVIWNRLRPLMAKTDARWTFPEKVNFPEIGPNEAWSSHNSF